MRIEECSTFTKPAMAVRQPCSDNHAQQPAGRAANTSQPFTQLYSRSSIHAALTRAAPDVAGGRRGENFGGRGVFGAEAALTGGWTVQSDRVMASMRLSLSFSISSSTLYLVEQNA